MSKPIPASEFALNFRHYTDQATVERIIEVSSNGQPIGAFLSQAEYEHYLRLTARETRNVVIDDLPDSLVRDLERTEYGVTSR